MQHRHHHNNHHHQNNKQPKSYNHVIQDPQDYMFTQKNILSATTFNKGCNEVRAKTSALSTFEKGGTKTLEKCGGTKFNKHLAQKVDILALTSLQPFSKVERGDSLFWCFYILKHGLSNYEMIGNQHFVVEKREKIHYVQLLRTKKDVLKLHKIKPMSEVEFDLTNNEKISVKTFFALCVMENINVLLVDKRKKYELQMNDGDVHVIHRNSESHEHHIEFNATSEKLKDYRDNYYSMETFDSKLKCMSSYKVSELMELCRKLNINIDIKTNEKKKMSKKDIYEIITLHL